MKAHAARFWTTVVSAAGLVGLYLTAASLDLMWAFWLCIALGVLVAGAPPAWKAVGDFSMRQRQYPKLLQRVTEAEQRNAGLEEAVEEMREASVQLYDDALNEGRAQMLAWVAGKGIREIPTISSVTVEEDELLLVARYGGEVPLTARERFLVRISDTGEVKGAVSARRADAERGVVYLGVVENRAPEYWEALRKRAVTDPSAPDLLELAKYEVEKSITLSRRTSRPSTTLGSL